MCVCVCVCVCVPLSVQKLHMDIAVPAPLGSTGVINSVGQMRNIPGATGSLNQFTVSVHGYG